MISEFYYWIYYILKKIKTNDNPEFNAFLGTLSFQYINIATIFGVANYIFVFKITKNLVIQASILVLIILAITNYYYFFCKRKELIKKFDKYSPEKRRKGKLIFFLYILVTLISSILVLVNFVVPK